MSDNKTIFKRFEDFRPSKGQWLGSCIAVFVATLIVGFSVGGWVTGGTAQELAANAAQEARAQLVASVCVENFADSNQFAKHLTSLKAADSWDRSDIITDAGWVMLPGMGESADAAAELCAERLVAMEIPAGIQPMEDVVVETSAG